MFTRIIFGAPLVYQRARVCRLDLTILVRQIRTDRGASCAKMRRSDVNTERVFVRSSRMDVKIVRANLLDVGVYETPIRRR